MSARELFENIRSERREIQEITDRIEKAETLAAGTKTILPQPVIVHVNKTGSAMEDPAIEAVELQEILNDRKKKLLQDMGKAEYIISQIRCADYRRVITAYYITGNTRRRMEDIAREIPCGTATAWRCLRKGMKAAEEVYLKVDRK